jgi:membrane associated rhomboid family serine protease
VLQVVTARSGIITNALALSPGSVLEGFQIWRLVTYAFCHDPGGLLHIFFNMYILWIVGRRLEPRYGSREFLLFYLSAIVVSGLAYLLLELILARPGQAIGASGAVAAAFILYAILYPHEKWLLFFVFPIEVRWLCLAFLAFDIHPVLLELGGGGAGGNVAHAAHLGGYLFGFLYYHQRWNLEQTFSGLRHLKLPKRRPKSQLKVYQPQRDSAEIEARTDEILQKISEQGEASLTDEERAILADASRRFRNRTRS